VTRTSVTAALGIFLSWRFVAITSRSFDGVRMALGRSGYNLAMNTCV
jgi:hypothetical protein